MQAMVELGRDIESRRKRDLLQLQSRLAGTDARGVGVSEAHDAGPRIAVAGAGGVLTHVSAADFAASHAGRRGAGDAAGLAREGEATDVGLPEGVVGSVPESVAAAVRAGRQLMPDVLWTPTLPGVRDRRSGRSNRRAYDIVSASYVLAEIDDPKASPLLLRGPLLIQSALGIGLWLRMRVWHPAAYTPTSPKLPHPAPAPCRSASAW